LLPAAEHLDERFFGTLGGVANLGGIRRFAIHFHEHTSSSQWSPTNRGGGPKIASHTPLLSVTRRVRRMEYGTPTGHPPDEEKVTHATGANPLRVTGLSPLLAMRRLVVAPGNSDCNHCVLTSTNKRGTEGRAILARLVWRNDTYRDAR
jgi:hypothetical protein